MAYLYIQRIIHADSKCWPISLYSYLTIEEGETQPLQ
nr:MAG TPA: hypothetical protein [Caudoviricetes sp.]